MMNNPTETKAHNRYCCYGLSSLLLKFKKLLNDYLTVIDLCSVMDS